MRKRSHQQQYQDRERHWYATSADKPNDDLLNVLRSRRRLSRADQHALAVHPALSVQVTLIDSRRRLRRSTLRLLAASVHELVRAKVAVTGSHRLPGDVIEALARDPSARVRSSLTRAERRPPPQHIIAALAIDPAVRESVAESRWPLPFETVMALAEDTDEQVRRGLPHRLGRRGPGLPPEALLLLMQDTDHVFRLVVENFFSGWRPGQPFPVVSFDSPVMRLYCARTTASPDLLRDFAASPDPAERRCVARNPQADDAILSCLADDPDPSVTALVQARVLAAALGQPTWPLSGYAFDSPT